MLIQLPDDAVSQGYCKTGPYEFAQVFTSESASFTGTEIEFVKAGKAYAYVQTSPFTRVVIS